MQSATGKLKLRILAVTTLNAAPLLTSLIKKTRLFTLPRVMRNFLRIKTDRSLRMREDQAHRRL